jgi:hypothetical protein
MAGRKRSAAAVEPWQAPLLTGDELPEDTCIDMLIERSLDLQSGDLLRLEALRLDR